VLQKGGAGCFEKGNRCAPELGAQRTKEGNRCAPELGAQRTKKEIGVLLS